MKYKVLLIIFIIGISISTHKVHLTYALISNSKSSDNNSFQSSSIDLKITDKDNQRLNILFDNTELILATGTTKSFFIKNTGKEPFEYELKANDFHFDDSLCDAIKVKLKKDNDLKFEGDLIDLKTTSSINSGTDDWTIELKFTNEKEELQNKKCGFIIKANAYQKGSDPSKGFSDKELFENSVKTDVWDLPNDQVLDPTTN